MSLARVYTVKKSRKEFTCGNCGVTIPKGSVVHHFSVGFRGRTQHRCDQHYPRLSERESSRVADVYAAIEDYSLAGDTLEDVRSAVEDVAAAAEEVASEYEQSEMYERNYDLQERAETLNTAAETLRNSLDDLPDEPDEDDQSTWPEGHDGTYASAHDLWWDEVTEAVDAALTEMELP